VQAIEVFLRTGSPFLTNADWGGADGVHSAWIVVESDSREHARNVVPPDFRSRARVTQLNAFSRERLDEIKRQRGLQ
jgi:hypothetical protein